MLQSPNQEYRDTKRCRHGCQEIWAPNKYGLGIRRTATRPFEIKAAAFGNVKRSAAGAAGFGSYWEYLIEGAQARAAWFAATGAGKPFQGPWKLPGPKFACTRHEHQPCS